MQAPFVTNIAHVDVHVHYNLILLSGLDPSVLIQGSILHVCLKGCLKTREFYSKLQRR